MEELGITHRAEVAVTDISGGERKRTSIGLALVTKPPVLFLDEPTTGLDAATADDVLGVVHKLASEGSRVVAATMHTPTSRAFRLLIDDVFVLSSAGIINESTPRLRRGSLNESR